MFKKIFLKTLFLCLTISTSYSQRVNFDQLKRDVLEAQTQKEKAQAMMVLGGALSPRETNKIFDYADSILLLTEADDRAYFENASTYLKAIGFYKKGDLLKAKNLFISSLAYFEDLGDDTHIKSLNFLGIIHLRTNNPDSAVIVFNKILDKVSEDNIVGRLSAHGNLGRAYRKLGKYSEAIENFELCVRLDSTNQFSILNSYLNVAGMYRDMEFYEKGIAILKQADISNIPAQPVLIAYYSNLGELYFRNDQLDTALFYLNKGLDLAMQLRQPQQSLGNRLTQVEIYLQKNDTESALMLLEAAKKDMTQYAPYPVRMDYTSKKAHYFLKSQLFDSAIQTAKKAIGIATENNSPNQIGNSYKIIAEAFDKKDNPDSSSYYYKLHVASRESQINAGKEKYQQEARAKYMLAQKDKEVTDSLIKSNQLKLWQKLLIGLLLLLCLIALYIFLRFKRSKTEVREQTSQNELLTKEIEKNKNDIIELKSRAILSVDDIISIKADGHYLEIRLINKSNPEVDRNQLKSILENLPSKFVQIHRSYAVNVDHIKIKQASKLILKDGSELPVSRTYKDSLNKAMNII